MGSIHPSGRYVNAGKISKTISTVAILRLVKSIFEKRAATVEVQNLTSLDAPPWSLVTAMVENAGILDKSKAWPQNAHPP